MAYGEHWEWRGFGVVSSRFAACYTKLSPFYEPHRLADEYLWIPGMEVNAKFREGSEEGLKFKRLLKKEEPFEVWEEKREDLFEFPLGSAAWKKLQTILREVHLPLPDYPPAAPGREATKKLLEVTGCRTILIRKERETRLWQEGNEKVLVEWTAIDTPQRCLSIGLENWSDDPKRDLTDRKAQKALERALTEMGLSREPLTVMNYLGAVETWIGGDKI